MQSYLDKIVVGTMVKFNGIFKEIKTLKAETTLGIAV